MTTVEVVDPGRPRFGVVLAQRGFRRLLLAHASATAAQLVVTLAVGLAVLARTGSGPGASLSIATGLLPYALLSGWAGVLADRWSRSRVLALSAGARCALATLLAAAIAGGAPTGLLVGLVALTAAAATPAYPALAAAAPECVPDHQLPAANGLVSGVENVGWLAGPGVLGLLVIGGMDPSAMVAVAAGCFLLATASAGTVGLPRPVRTAVTRPWSDLRVGIGILLRVRRARGSVALMVLNNLLFGAVLVGVVLVAGEGSRWVGWFTSALAVGAVLGLLLVTALAQVPGGAALLMLAFAVSAAAVGVLGAGLPGAVAVGAAGGAALVAEVLAVTEVQRALPGEVVARAIGVCDQVDVGAIALGSVLSGVLAPLLGPRPALAAIGSAVAVLTFPLLRVTARVPGPVPVACADGATVP